MKQGPPRRSLPCPCCGAVMDLESGRCACGARFVGEPVLEPPRPRPVVGAAVASLAFALLALVGLWFRPLALLAPVAIAFGVRAVRAARRDPSRYGGRRAAVAGLSLSLLFTVVAGGYLASRVPRLVEQRREASAAATRAEMYHIAGLVEQYRAAYGAYPERLSELARLEELAAPPDARDSWDQKILYSGFTSGIASAAGALTLNANFELRSAGPDGLPNTPDDIVMRDGSIVDAPGSGSPAPPTLPVTVPVTKRAR